MPFTIRRAATVDLPALLALESSFPGDRLLRGNFRHLVTRARADVWTCVAGETLVGNAIVLYRTGSRRTRLYSLVVDPAARGRGFARALVEVSKRAAAERGCATMYLEVRSDNLAAISLYRKLGYRFVRHMPAYYDDGQDAFRLECPLEAPAAAPRRAA